MKNRNSTKPRIRTAKTASTNKSQTNRKRGSLNFKVAPVRTSSRFFAEIADVPRKPLLELPLEFGSVAREVRLH